MKSVPMGDVQGSLSSSCILILSGPTRSAELDCLRRTPSGQPQAVRGPEAPGSLIPVEVEFDLETVA
jgi:hypothetical protein